MSEAARVSGGATVRDRREDAPEDRRRARGTATASAIRRAALELVAEHGLDETSVEAIAERAGVGYRTFFNHFASKEDALVEPGAARAAAMTTELDARPAAETPLEAMRAVLLVEAASLEERTAELALRLAVFEANPSLMRRFHAEFAVLERALIESIGRRVGQEPEQQLYPRLLASVAIAALRSSFLLWRAGADPATDHPDGALIALVDEAFHLLAAGLPAPQ